MKTFCGCFKITPSFYLDENADTTKITNEFILKFKNTEINNIRFIHYPVLKNHTYFIIMNDMRVRFRDSKKIYELVNKLNRQYIIHIDDGDICIKFVCGGMNLKNLHKNA